MLKYLILLLIALLAIVTIVYLYRKKHMSIILDLEGERYDISDYPVFEELAKVKQLNMTGEAEEQFERWRNEWLEVTDTKIPKLDGLLFEAEEALQRFQFKKSTALEVAAASLIEQCIEQKDRILQELDELVGSEERSRIEIETLQDKYRAARKAILAHQHDYGRAFGPIEERLEQLVPKFEQYDALIEEGNYVTADALVDELAEEGKQLFMLVRETPNVLTSLKKTLPEMIRELKNGVLEMEEQGYDLYHLRIHEQLEDIEEALVYLERQVKELDIEYVQGEVEFLEEQFDIFYEGLEKEYESRRYVHHHFEESRKHIIDLLTKTRALESEAEEIQESYELEEEETDFPERKLQELSYIRQSYEPLVHSLTKEKIPYALVAEDLKRLVEEAERCEEEVIAFEDRIKRLRIDENRVKSSVDELTRTLQLSERKLQTSNLPGIPETIDVRLEQAAEQLYVVNRCLSAEPINMKMAEEHLQEADEEVHDVAERIEDLIHDASLFEAIVRYGNRYRGSHDTFDQRMSEAEQYFLEARYEMALETAGTAVEDVEPGAMSKIEQLLNENV